MCRWTTSRILTVMMRPRTACIISVMEIAKWKVTDHFERWVTQSYGEVMFYIVITVWWVSLLTPENDVVRENGSWDHG